MLSQLKKGAIALFWIQILITTVYQVLLFPRHSRTLANFIGVTTVLSATYGTRFWTIELQNTNFCSNLLREEGGRMRVPGALSRIYFENKSSKKSFEEQRRMTQMIETALRERMDIDASEWLDAETLRRAKEKLDAVKAEIGYPEWISDTAIFQRFYDTVSLWKKAFEKKFFLIDIFKKNQFD